jgi:hypothetical protein
MKLAPKMSLWYRIGAIALGVAGLGSGGAAVFLTHVEAGPVALITAGFLLLVIGASGQLPNRLKIGDNEAEWYEVFRRVQETAEATAEVTAAKTARSELEIAMRRIEKGSPEAAESVMMEAFLYHARDALSEAVSKLEGVEHQWHKVGGMKYRVICGSNGKKAYSEIVRYTDKFNLIDRQMYMLSMLADAGVDRMLLITNGELPRATRALAMKDPLIEMVAISREDDGEDTILLIMDAISSLLELPRK